MNLEKATRLVLALIDLTNQHQIEWTQNITHEETFSQKSFWGYWNGKHFRLYGTESTYPYLTPIYRLQLWSENKTFEYEYPYTPAYRDLFNFVSEQNSSFFDQYTDELLAIGSPQ